MDFITIILIIFGVVSWLNKKKQKEAEERRKADQAGVAWEKAGKPDMRQRTPVRPSVAPTVSPRYEPQRDDRFPSISEDELREKRYEHAKRAEELAKKRDELQRRKKAVSSREQSVYKASQAPYVSEPIETSLSPGRVSASTESIRETAADKSRTLDADTAFGNFIPERWSSDNLAQGIVIAEILGKPKALRAK